MLRLYSIDKVRTETTTTPAFIHDGHLPDWDNADMPVVTHHAWLRSQERTLLSTSNSAQLHVWKFNDDGRV